MKDKLGTLQIFKTQKKERLIVVAKQEKRWPKNDKYIFLALLAQASGVKISFIVRQRE